MSLLDQILAPQALRVVFQPIVDIGGPEPRLRSVESLTRGPLGTNLESPDVLFDFVRRKHAEPEVDRRCVVEVLAASALLPRHLPFSVNVHASTLARDRDFLAFFAGEAQAGQVSLDRVTLEIVEHAPPWDGRGFQAALVQMRELGLKIALDDVGLGHSNYKMILDCRPDVFKIDRYFVAEIHKDPHRRMVIESVANLAHRFGGQVVAEGLETEADLAVLRDLKVDLAQGYLFSPPRAAEELKRLGIFNLESPFAAVPGDQEFLQEVRAS